MNPNNNQSVQKSQDAAAASVFHPVENKNKSSAGGASGTAAPSTSAVAKNPATEASRQQEMEVV